MSVNIAITKIANYIYSKFNLLIRKTPKTKLKFKFNNRIYTILGTKMDNRLISTWEQMGDPLSTIRLLDLCRIVRVPEDSVIFDVGANIGKNSLVYSNIANKGTVYAFEPIKMNFDALVGNIKRNKIKNIIPLNFGLSDKEEYLKIGIPDKSQHSRYLRKINSGLFSVYFDEKKSNYTSFVSKFITLDQFVSDNGLFRIDVIKIDVEGHEYAVIRGAKESIKKFKPLIEMELNGVTADISRTDPNKLIDYLTELGYKPFFLSPDENELLEFNKEMLSAGLFRKEDNPYFLDMILIHKEKLPVYKI